MTVYQCNPNRIIHAFIRVYYPGGFYNTTINYRPYITLSEAVREQMGEGVIYSPIDEFFNVKTVEKT
jgi:hypothetical protein